jgi:hypothetical protein
VLVFVIGVFKATADLAVTGSFADLAVTASFFIGAASGGLADGVTDLEVMGVVVPVVAVTVLGGEVAVAGPVAGTDLEVVVTGAIAVSVFTGAAESGCLTNGVTDLEVVVPVVTVAILGGDVAVTGLAGAALGVVAVTGGVTDSFFV